MLFWGNRVVTKHLLFIFVVVGIHSAIITSTIFPAIASAQDSNLLSGNYPMVQTSTGDSSVQINVLIPRLKQYAFKATPVGGGPSIEALIVGSPMQDPQKLLHEKAIKVQFNGLKPGTQYELEMIELFRSSRYVVDKRRFKTTDSAPGPLKIQSVSCMCDENKYRPVRSKVWMNALKQNPDVIVATGDLTYVDSFDYVERNKATPFDIWTRYFRSFDQNPMTRAFDLVPVYASWDDHDTGVNDGNSTTPTLPEAQKAFSALYGSDAVDGFVEKGKGIYSFVKMKGQNLLVLDARTYRKPHTVNERYSHLGQEQEEWALKKLSGAQGPIHVFKGDMWGTPTVMAGSGEGRAARRITESFFGDHPMNYKAFMEKLFALNKALVLHSGDIHFSEVLKYGPDFKNTSFHAPFNTVEVTSSPVYSIIFFAGPGEPEFWENPQRVVGAKQYNIVTIESIPGTSNSFQVKTLSMGPGPEPLFKSEHTITCEDAVKK